LSLLLSGGVVGDGSTAVMLLQLAVTSITQIGNAHDTHQTYVTGMGFWRVTSDLNLDGFINP
jgi:hypothetical protein